MRKKDFNVIKKLFEDGGCVLLTTVYKNNRQKLKYICSAGHSCSITRHDWQSGRRCNICSTEQGVKNEEWISV